MLITAAFKVYLASKQMSCEWLMDSWEEIYRKSYTWHFYLTVRKRFYRFKTQSVCTAPPLPDRSSWSGFLSICLSKCVLCVYTQEEITLQRWHVALYTDHRFKVLWIAQASPLLTMGQTFIKGRQYTSKAAIYCNSQANKGMYTDIHWEAQSFQHIKAQNLCICHLK